MGDAKRKGPPRGASQPQAKKSKRGNEGKWQTPHQRSNLNQRLELGTTIEAGDAGIWVTCQRGLERKAISEMLQLCDELGEEMYGIKPPREAKEEAALEDNETQDIADAIQGELADLKAEPKRPKADYTFLPVRAGIECVFFVKTRKPVDPVELVGRICDDAEKCTTAAERRLRHVNRLVPVTVMGKALDNGIEKVAREVLGAFFKLKPEEGEGAGAGAVSEAAGGKDEPKPSYAIRQNIRASALKRDEVINRVAALVSPAHKVNLGNPDKVVFIEIFKNYCGVSVVDGPRWEALRKYNINEIYKLATGKPAKAEETGKEETVETKGEATEEAKGDAAGETKPEGNGQPS